MSIQWRSLLQALGAVWLAGGDGPPTDADADDVGSGSLYLSHSSTSAPALYVRHDDPARWGAVDDPDVFNIRAFGARGDATTDDGPAIRRAIAAASQGGGVVHVPRGHYRVVGTIDLEDAEGIWMRGVNVRASVLEIEVTGSPGVRLASGARNKGMRLTDLTISHRAFSRTQKIPTARAAGTWGIANARMIPNLTSLERVGVQGFPDSGIRFEGPTGPVAIRDCSVMYCAGHGIELTTVSGEGTGNVTVDGGAIQQCWGGIRVTNGQAFSAIGVDIELGAVARYPALHVIDHEAGVVVGGGSFSVRGGNPPLTPNGVIVLENTRGAVLMGVQNFSYQAADNLLIEGARSENNSIVGGAYVNAAAGGGYFATVNDARGTVLVNPSLRNFAAGRGIIRGSASAATLRLG